MDDTQQSRVSDAAATRKRRSSILKSQRPARTPFSELEFNVATPTDTAKSRRVSFSRRTGVAEFITNDATTTWKNFYEEHNKSLESSSNDSEATGSRQPVGHLGKRIFDQQFEEVEAVDFISTLKPVSSSNGSINSVNFTQQLASFDSTVDGKLTAPITKFELSALTDQHSKLFGNDFTVPNVGEMSGRIDVNFSAIQQIGEKDDLDEIQRDIARVSSNMCHGIHFSDRQNMSEYIEVDLNVTHGALRNEDDMSITDTVHSPVQDVSKSNVKKDWVTDKENIVINPYAAPHESINFAINEEPEQVLVFDGKRLTLQPDNPEKDKNYRQTLLPNSSAETPQRKTIVLNVNDDLPNFAEDTRIDHHSGISGVRDFNSDYDNDDEVSTTLAVNRVDIVPKKKLMVESIGNISMTHALPTNIITETAQESSDRRRTILFDEGAGNVSVTQAVPVKILSNHNNPTERRRTVVYEDDTGNISITQAVPTNIFVNESFESNDKRKTIVFDEDKGNISVTQVLSSNIIIDDKIVDNKRKTIVHNDEKGNVSVTQASSSNIIDVKDIEKRKTIVFDNDAGNVSITQALPVNIVLSDIQPQEKRRTIIYEDDSGNISVTQGISSNLIVAQNSDTCERKHTVVYEDDTGNISVTQIVPSNILLDNSGIYSYNSKSSIVPTTQSLPNTIILKDSDGNRRRTIVYGDDTGNISITQALSSQLIADYADNAIFKSAALDLPKGSNESTTRTKRSHKQRTIAYDNDDNDISMTEAIPTNIIVSDEATNKRKTILFDNDDANISMTQAIPINVFLLEKLDSAVDQSIKMQIEEANENVIDYDTCKPVPPILTIEDIQEKRKTVVVHADDGDVEMSITEAIPKVQNIIKESEKRKTVIFDIDNGNISMTKPIPAELLAYQNEILNKSRTKHFNMLEQELVPNPSPDVIVYQASTTGSAPKLQSNRTDQGDLKSERPIHSDNTSEAKDMSSSKVIDTVEGSVQEDVGSEDISLIHPRVEEKSEKWNLKPLNITVDLAAKVVDVMETQKETADTEVLLLVEKPTDFVLNATKDIQLIETPKESVLNTTTDLQSIATLKESALSTAPDPESFEKPKNSVLNALLDMSYDISSMESGTVEKNVMAQIESNHSSARTKEETDGASSESMFYITKDSDEEAQTDRELDKDKSFNIAPIVEASALSELEDEEPPVVDDLQKKLAELKTAASQDNHTSINRIFEKIANVDLEDVVEKDENVKLREQSMTFRRANDTKELLDMISDFTDKKDDNESVVIKVKGPSLTESKTSEPKRLSFASNRQSIALTREDFLSNISMAQAALQKSRINLDETDSLEDDSKDESMDQSFQKKSTRTSNEVVKTLNFDDESFSESSLKSETRTSPLKKTAFGETAYMTESKVKVIPTYLKDVSDGVKALMLDLVKPMSDNLPFEAPGIDKWFRKIPSTQSMQVQANLLTSSQVDMETELYSNTESGYDINKTNNFPGALLHRSRSRSLKSPVKFSTNCSDKSSDFDVPSPGHRYMYTRVPIEQPTGDKVLVFDHLNPLNNILLGSIDYTDAHKYNPKRSDETLCGSERNPSPVIHDDKDRKDNEYETGNTSTQFRIESQVTHARKGDNLPYKHDDQNSLLSNTSKPISIDQSIDAKLSDLKDNEANTLIAMKGNKELLEASSSLTLVDDAMAQQPEGDSDSKETTKEPQDDASPSHHKVKISKSPVEIIYKIEEQTATIDNDMKTEMTSPDEEMANNDKKSIRCKKRNYSPTKVQSSTPPVDMTPKPNSKMLKISASPSMSKRVLTLVAAEELLKMAAEKDVAEFTEQIKLKDSNVQDKKKPPRKSKDKKPGTDITVQQLITEYHVDAGINENIIDKHILDALNPKSDSSTAPASQSDVQETNSLEVVSSFTSSKNLNAMKDVHSMSTTQSHQSQQSTNLSKGSRVDWHPDLISAISSNLTDSDSAVNVVAKIDMLPFMGSHECEWENSSADTWSFRLLHGRLRLTARLAHRHDNATRTRVRGDTPVLDVGVEIVQHDKKNPVALLCVRFACETMRYMVSRACRGPCYASDIPPLLRRCAAVARVALRWGRAMHDAKLHLAYTLDNDGYLTLKVANIPLRSVWEVSMRVELVVEDAREAPWPRAGHVRVARVVSDVSVPEQHVRAALAHTPRDWGHAPRTIWRMFRYLKHKTRDDDILL